MRKLVDKSEQIFIEALSKIDITSINLNKEDNFRYPASSYHDVDLKNFLINKMSDSIGKEEKKFILHDKQHANRISPEIYILNNQYCYQISFEMGIKIFNNQMNIIAQFNPFVDNDTTNTSVMTIGHYNILDNGKSNIHVTNSICLLTAQVGPELKVNFHKANKHKNNIDSIKLSDDIIVSFKSCLYRNIIFDNNFNMIKVILNDDLKQKFKNTFPHTFDNIKNYEHFVSIISEQLEIYKLMKDDNINFKSNIDQFQLQMKDIKDIVNNFQFIFNQTRILDRLRRELSLNIGMFEFCKPNNIKRHNINQSEDIAFMNKFGENIIDKLYKSNGHFHKKTHKISTLVFLEYLNHHEIPVLDSVFLNKIENTIEEVEKTRLVFKKSSIKSQITP